MPNLLACSVVLALTLAGCDKAISAPLVWDLSKDNELARVNWPKGQNSEILHLDEPGTIHIKARGGLVVDTDFWFAQVWRVGNHVGTVCIMLPPGNVEQTYALATQFADAWNLPDRRGFNDFRQNHGKRLESGTSGVSVASHSKDDDVQQRAIEIRQSFAGQDKPFYVTLILGFPDQEGIPSSTQPASRPRSD